MTYSLSFRAPNMAIAASTISGTATCQFHTAKENPTAKASNATSPQNIRTVGA